MSELTSGQYAPHTVKKVHHWPSPDVNGNGAEIWEDVTDSQGRSLGRSKITDSSGKPVRAYDPPEGFQNRPSYDHTDNYVLVNGHGEPVRTPSGEAIILKPGQSVVISPDGSVEYLTDDYARYVFLQQHEKVSE